MQKYLLIFITLWVVVVVPTINNQQRGGGEGNGHHLGVIASLSTIR